jgi:hypothetical protein
MATREFPFMYGVWHRQDRRWDSFHSSTAEANAQVTDYGDHLQVYPVHFMIGSDGEAFAEIDMFQGEERSDIDGSLTTDDDGVEEYEEADPDVVMLKYELLQQAISNHQMRTQTMSSIVPTPMKGYVHACDEDLYAERLRVMDLPWQP